MQSQTNFFNRLSGCTPASGVTFPNFERLAYAYDIPYYRCNKHEEVDTTLKKFFDEPLAAICEVLEDADQPIAPKSKSKLLPNGQLISPPAS